VPGLERMASDTNHPVHVESAINTLNVIGKDAVPALLRIATNPNSPGRWHAFLVLGNMGTNAEQAVPALVELARSKDVVTADQALKTLGALQLCLQLVVPLLAEYVDHPKLHYVAISTLVDYQSQARPAIPRLVQCLTNLDHDIAIAAARALARLKLESDLVVPALVNCLKTRDSELRQAAIAALKQYLSPDSAMATTQSEGLGGLRREWLTYSMANETEELTAKGPGFSYYRPRAGIKTQAFRSLLSVFSIRNHRSNRKQSQPWDRADVKLPRQDLLSLIVSTITHLKSQLPQRRL